MLFHDFLFWWTSGITGEKMEDDDLAAIRAKRMAQLQAAVSFSDPYRPGQKVYCECEG